MIRSKDTIINTKDALILQLKMEISRLQKQLEDTTPNIQCKNTQQEHLRPTGTDGRKTKGTRGLSGNNDASIVRPRGEDNAPERSSKNTIHSNTNVNKQLHKEVAMNSVYNLPSTSKSNTFMKQNDRTTDDSKSGTSEDENKDDSWSTVVSRRNRRPTKPNRRQQKQIGSAPVTENTPFQGKEGNPNKKIWLCLTRVKDNVTEDHIRQYVAEKTKDNPQDIVVKKISIQYNRPDSLCFQVGVRTELLE